MKKMTGKAKIIAVCLIALLALVVGAYIPQVEPLPTDPIQGIARAELPLAEPPPEEPKPEEPKPEEPVPVEPPPEEPPPVLVVKPTEHQIDEIRKAIEKAQKEKMIAKKHLVLYVFERLPHMLFGLPFDEEAARGHREKVQAALERARPHGQKAADLANEYYGINVQGANALGAWYCPYLPSEGLAEAWLIDGQIRTFIAIGNGAFRSPSWLAATLLHERIHAEQFRRLGLALFDINLSWCSPRLHELEIEAYMAELAVRFWLCLSTEEIAEIERRIREHREALRRRCRN